MEGSYGPFDQGSPNEPFRLVQEEQKTRKRVDFQLKNRLIESERKCLLGKKTKTGFALGPAILQSPSSVS